MNIERLNPWSWLSSDKHHHSDNTLTQQEETSKEHRQPLMYLQQEVDNFIGGSLRSFGLTSNVFGDDLFHHNSPFKPKLDVISSNDQYQLMLEVPGMKKEALSITIDSEHITISGKKDNMVEDQQQGLHHKERCYGQFTRLLTLPKDADPDHIQAVLNNGILELTIPRAAHSHLNVKTIPITQEEYH